MHESTLLHLSPCLSQESSRLGFVYIGKQYLVAVWLRLHVQRQERNTFPLCIEVRCLAQSRYILSKVNGLIDESNSFKDYMIEMCYL